MGRQGLSRQLNIKGEELDRRQLLNLRLTQLCTNQGGLVMQALMYPHPMYILMA